MGHLYILRGDVTKIACDDWLVSSDAQMNFGNWQSFLGSRVATLPTTWPTEDKQPFALAGWPDDMPQPWFVEIGVTRDDHNLQWLTERISAALDCVTDSERRFQKNRDRRLVALPLVGTGRGGFEGEPGKVVWELMPTLERSIEKHDIDVALVLWTDAQYAAAQAYRARHMPDAFDELSEPTRSLRDQLAHYATTGRLTPFIGSGLSANAGLPDWFTLLEKVADVAELDNSVRALLKKRDDSLDWGDVLSRVLGDRMGPIVADLIGTDRPYSLGHGLLASLPITEAVTTNYDNLFEQAWVAATHERVDVLPYSPSRERRRWLLKLHGCVEHPNDIVLSRESFLRYDVNRAALKGIVQGLLMPNHLLFLGFSFNDSNFHRIADDVRRAVHPHREQGRQEESPTFGTALTLFPEPLLKIMWSEVHQMALCERPDDSSEQPAKAKPARQLEILLDYIGSKTAGVSHLLEKHYEPILNGPERELREALDHLAHLSPEAMRTPAGARVWELLRSLGARDE